MLRKDLKLLDRIQHNMEPSSIHLPHQCANGTYCCIHNPSLHKMRDWPMNLRETGLIERLCEHGVGHPDPDSAAWLDRQHKHKPGTWSVHGCDGCCGEPEEEPDIPAERKLLQSMIEEVEGR